MARRLLALVLLSLASFALGDEAYLSLYLQGIKLGYVSTTTSEDEIDGVKLTKTETRQVVSAGLLGAAMRTEVVSTSWTDGAGSPRFLKATITSAGREHSIDAKFSADRATVKVKNGEEVTERVLEIPKDGRLVDDALNALLEGGATAGRTGSFYVLDVTTATFVKNTVRVVGKAQAIVKGLAFDATLIEVSEPRATLRVFVSAKGDLIKAEGPMGIEMIPTTKEDALREEPSSGGFADLALLTSIRPDRPLGNARDLTSVKLRVSGAHLGAAPSDEHQQIVAEGTAWIVETHPVAVRKEGTGTIRQAAAFAQKWVKSDTYVPVSNSELTRLSKRIVNGETNVVAASEKVRSYVTRNMTPNAGIGVLRDASEVLKTKEGVCRDYAILTLTLLRSSGIPSRLVTGLVYDQGAFYYHAWVEVFDGKQWFGVDSTRPDGRVTAGHIKLAQGTVESAILFTFLDKVSVEVLETKRKAAGNKKK